MHPKLVAKKKNLELAISESNLLVQRVNQSSVFARSRQIFDLAKKKRENVLARLQTESNVERTENGFLTPFAMDLILFDFNETKNDLVVD